MPVVPDFANDVQLHNVPLPQADARAFGAPGRAIAQGFGALSDQMAEFNERYIQAKRQADAANTVASVSKQLGDAQFKWSKVADRQQAYDGFNAESKTILNGALSNIRDPLIKAYVTERTAPEATTRALETQNAAFQLESSKHRGDLDTNLLQFSDSAASAGSDVLRAKLTDDGMAAIHGAVAGGWLAPEEGAQKVIGFRSRIQEVRVRQLMNHALDTQSPAEIRNLTHAVGDPAQFPGLLPETRETIGTRLENMSYRLETRAIAQQAHSDAVAERNLRLGQQANEAKLFAFVLKGGDIPNSALAGALEHQQITPAGADAVLSMRNRAENGRDDPHVALQFWHGVGTNQLTPDAVYGAFNAGHLSKDTATGMIRALDAKGSRGDNAVTKAYFNTLKTALSGAAIEQGGLGLFNDKQTAALTWASAQAEWSRRVVAGGEDARAVLTDMVPRYATASVKPTWLPPLPGGTPQSTKEVMAHAAKLGALYKAKQIAPADFEAQGATLNQYRRYYMAEDALHHATRNLKGAPTKGGAQIVGVQPGGAP